MKKMNKFWEESLTTKWKWKSLRWKFKKLKNPQKLCNSVLSSYLSKVNCKNEENQQILGRHYTKKKEKKKKKSNIKALASRAKKNPKSLVIQIFK